MDSFDGLVYIPQSALPVAGVLVLYSTLKHYLDQISPGSTPSDLPPKVAEQLPNFNYVAVGQCYHLTDLIFSLYD